MSDRHNQWIAYIQESENSERKMKKFYGLLKKGCLYKKPWYLRKKYHGFFIKKMKNMKISKKMKTI